MARSALFVVASQHSNSKILICSANQTQRVSRAYLLTDFTSSFHRPLLFRVQHCYCSGIVLSLIPKEGTENAYFGLK